MLWAFLPLGLASGLLIRTSIPGLENLSINAPIFNRHIGRQDRFRVDGRLVSLIDRRGHLCTPDLHTLVNGTIVMFESQDYDDWDLERDRTNFDCLAAAGAIAAITTQRRIIDPGFAQFEIQKSVHSPNLDVECLYLQHVGACFNPKRPSQPANPSGPRCAARHPRRDFERFLLRHCDGLHR